MTGLNVDGIRCQEPLISVYGYLSSNYCSFESQLIDFLGEITKKGS